MRIIWTRLAKERLIAISDHIAKDNPKAAEQWEDKITSRVDVLENFPEIGRIVPELKRPEIRELLEGKYRIIYQYGQEEVRVLTIRHVAQLLPKDEIE
jgi:plasmid stabilization system protein ParE